LLVEVEVNFDLGNFVEVEVNFDLENFEVAEHNFEDFVQKVVEIDCLKYFIDYIQLGLDLDILMVVAYTDLD